MTSRTARTCFTTRHTAAPRHALYYTVVVAETGAMSRLGSLEAEVMEVLWSSAAPRTVREVLDALNERRPAPLAYTTVMTVLVRLADKGVLVRDQHGRSFTYAPVISDEAALAVRDVVRDYGEAAVAHLVEEARADPKLYRRLRRLMGDEE